MLLPSIKYDFTILQRINMILIILKTIHTLHHKNQENKYWWRFTVFFHPIIWLLVINTFESSYSLCFFRGWCARINKYAYSLFTNNRRRPAKRNADPIIEWHWCNVLMLFQHYPIIGSSARICWQVTMCARVDMGKENQDKDKGKHNTTILI